MIEELKKIYANGKFEINGRSYELVKMPYKKARKVFAFMTTVANEIDSGQVGFIDSPKFENEIEPLLMQFMTHDGFKLDTMPEHFEEFTVDYMPFVTMAVQVISCPFLPDQNTASTSTAKEGRVHSLKKPM